MIVDASGALRRVDRVGDLTIRQSLAHSQHEHLALRRREARHGVPQPFLRLVRHHPVERIVLGGDISFLHLHLLPSPPNRPPPVEHEPARDREQPRAERALPAKAVDRAEGTHERVLHHLVHVLAGADARDEARHGGSVPLDQQRRGPLLSRLPPCHKVEVGSLIGGGGDIGHAVQPV